MSFQTDRGARVFEGRRGATRQLGAEPPWRFDLGSSRMTATTFLRTSNLDSAVHAATAPRPIIVESIGTLLQAPTTI